MSVDIGSLVVCSPDMKHGRPRIAGTGTTVHRIAIWYKLGYSPEEMVRKYPHLTLAQAHAARYAAEERLMGEGEGWGNKSGMARCCR